MSSLETPFLLQFYQIVLWSAWLFWSIHDSHSKNLPSGANCYNFQYFGNFTLAVFPQL